MFFERTLSACLKSEGAEEECDREKTDFSPLLLFCLFLWKSSFHCSPQIHLSSFIFTSAPYSTCPTAGISAVTSDGSSLPEPQPQNVKPLFTAVLTSTRVYCPNISPHLCHQMQRAHGSACFASTLQTNTGSTGAPKAFINFRLQPSFPFKLQATVQCAI